MLRLTLPSNAPVTRRALVIQLQDMLERGASISASSSSRSSEYHKCQAFQRRLQSSLCSTTTAHRGGSRRGIVDPSLRQRRPHVNGEAVAFHIRDLLSPPPSLTGSSSSLDSSVSTDEEAASLERREYESDLVVVLDMDECLLHSVFLSNPAAVHVLAHQLQQSRRRQNDNAHATTTTGSADNQPLPPPPPPLDHLRIQLPHGGDLVHVNLRPGLRDFLRHVCQRYETHVFTAALPVYAQPVLDQLDPDGTLFAGRWYRDHCVWDDDAQAYVKDLRALALPDDERRTVLVDNNPLSFLTHASNGILVSSFYDNPHDTTLLAVQHLLRQLEPFEDVRPYLEQRFGLQHALDEWNKTPPPAQDAPAAVAL